MKDFPTPQSSGIPRPGRRINMKSLTKSIDQGFISLISRIRRDSSTRLVDRDTATRLKPISPFPKSIATLSRKINSNCNIQKDGFGQSQTPTNINNRRNISLTPIISNKVKALPDSLKKAEDADCNPKVNKPIEKLFQKDELNKERSNIICKVKTKLLKLSFKALNKLRLRQNKSKFKFVIFTKGLQRICKLNPMHVKSVKLKKITQPISKISNNLLQNKSSSRNISVLNQMSAQQSVAPFKNDQTGFKIICITVSNLDDNNHCNLRDIYISNSEDRSSYKLMFKRSNLQVLTLKKRQNKGKNMLTVQNQYEGKRSKITGKYCSKPGTLLLPSISHLRNSSEYNKYSQMLAS